MTTVPPTPNQLDYVSGLKRKLKLSPALLDTHCVARFCVPFARISKQQCSVLLEEMKDWSAIPVQLMREAGQTDMFQ